MCCSHHGAACSSPEYAACNSGDGSKWNIYEFAGSYLKDGWTITLVHSCDHGRDTLLWSKYTEGWYCLAIVLYHLLVIAPRLKADRQTGGYCNCRGAHNRANSGGSAKQQSARGFIIYARLPPGPTYKTRVCRPPFAWTCNFALPSASFAHSCIHPLMIICPNCWNKINIEHFLLFKCPPHLFALSSMYYQFFKYPQFA